MRTISREEAIRDLRASLVALTDENTSACEVAGRLGVFCGGHRRLKDEEMHQIYDWIVLRQKPQDREELDDLANRWQLSQQESGDQALACDVQTEQRDTCLGWNEFSNEQLIEHYQTLRNEPVRIQ